MSANKDKAADCHYPGDMRADIPRRCIYPLQFSLVYQLNGQGELVIVEALALCQSKRIVLKWIIEVIEKSAFEFPPESYCLLRCILQ